MRPKGGCNQLGIFFQRYNGIVMTGDIVADFKCPAVIQFVNVEHLVEFVIAGNDDRLFVIIGNPVPKRMFRIVVIADITYVACQHENVAGDFNRFNEEHYRCFRFLEKSVKQSTAGHILVATHHVPSFELMSPEFKDSPLNGAFTELGSFIANSPIEYWIYGHSHRNIDKIIGNTRCVSNQLGYVSGNEHHSFDKGKYRRVGMLRHRG